MKQSKTYGLTHIALAVKDVNRTLEFYKKVFDVQVMYDQENFVQVQTPGSNDIIVFEEEKDAPFGNSGGIAHFGFRLRDPKDINEIVNRVKKADGIITDQGEFVPGEPYVFFKDPDGYEVEVWYER
jgi:catechol 2,3-dioxygenase-like lactoylglutathione lyase family enzyme